MNKISALLLVMGISAISACASNDVADDATSEAESAQAQMAEDKAAAEAKVDAEVDAAEADVAEVKGDAEGAAEQAAPADESADDSENLVSTCTYDGQTRIITVVYDDEESDALCQVTYEKSTGVQTLWSANNERDYCKDRAAEFVKKQEGWGWTCTNLE